MSVWTVPEPIEGFVGNSISKDASDRLQLVMSSRHSALRSRNTRNNWNVDVTSRRCVVKKVVCFANSHTLESERSVPSLFLVRANERVVSKTLIKKRARILYADYSTSGKIVLLLTRTEWLFWNILKYIATQSSAPLVNLRAWTCSA